MKGGEANLQNVIRHYVQMKTFITALSSIFFTVLLSGQDTVFVRQNNSPFDDSIIYTTDTVIFPSAMTRHVITGTSILPWTHNQQRAKGYGLYFTDVSKSDCQAGGVNVELMSNHINSIDLTDSSLTIDFSIAENCCYDFLCDIAVDSAGTLNLIFYGYGTYCACECCFGLTYHMALLKDPDYKDVKAAMINGDRKTLKQVKK